ncbi:retrovirus-related pol polyprotein from transposon TNT 1-94, partial [Tanacetum coccineum]
DYLKRSIWYLDSGCSRHMTWVKQYLHIYSKESGPKVVFRDNSSGDTKGYGSVNCNGITFTRVAYGTIFNQNDEVVLIAPRRIDVYIIDMLSYNEESNKHKLEDFCNEKGISQNFLSPCTPEQNGVAERRNRTLIEAARTMLNYAKLPKQFWGEVVNTTCYTLNRSIIVKRHGKTTYDVFKGRSHDISYFHVFGCPVNIHNHIDHLGKFDEKANDGFFLEGDAINFNKNRSFHDDEFLEPRSKVTQCLGNIDYFPYILAYDHLPTNNTTIPENNITPADSPIPQDSVSPKEPLEFTNNVINEPISDVQPSPTTISPSAEVNCHPPVPQDRWSKEKHIELVNIIEAIKALEEEGWIIAMQEKLNQFERNKVWTLVPTSHGKTITGTKWIWKNNMDKLKAIRIFLAYAAYMGFMVYQMDVRNVFLNGKISEEVYVQQPPGFESSEFPNYVCKPDKALYGLKQAPKAWYQANPKESYLVSVKRIFRYLNGTPNLAEAEYVAAAGCCAQVL